MTRKPSILAAGVFASFMMVGTVVFAQKASVPKAQNAPRLTQDDVQQLLLLIDKNKDGKITKDEWMKFMSEEFDRLDRDHSGDLDAKDLEQSRVRASRPFSAAGK